MKIKRISLFLLLFVFGLSMMAQGRFGLVKDEDGYTNVRKGPGTNYEIIDKVQDGMFIYFAPAVNGWCKVYNTFTDGTTPEFFGYMSAKKIVVPPRKGVYKQVAYVKDEDGYTNIRKGPGTKYAIAARVKDGSYILVSGGYEDKWLKIYTQNGVLRGFISANKVNFLESPQF